MYPINNYIETRNCLTKMNLAYDALIRNEKQYEIKAKKSKDTSISDHLLTGGGDTASQKTKEDLSKVQKPQYGGDSTPTLWNLISNSIYKASEQRSQKLTASQNLLRLSYGEILGQQGFSAGLNVVLELKEYRKKPSNVCSCPTKIQLNAYNDFNRCIKSRASLQQTSKLLPSAKLLKANSRNKTNPRATTSKFCTETSWSKLRTDFQETSNLTSSRTSNCSYTRTNYVQNSNLVRTTNEQLLDEIKKCRKSLKSVNGSAKPSTSVIEIENPDNFKNSSVVNNCIQIIYAAGLPMAESTGQLLDNSLNDDISVNEDDSSDSQLHFHKSNAELYASNNEKLSFEDPPFEAYSSTGEIAWDLWNLLPFRMLSANFTSDESALFIVMLFILLFLVLIIFHLFLPLTLK